MTRQTKIVLGALAAVGAVGVYLHFRKKTPTAFASAAVPAPTVTNIISSGFERILSSVTEPKAATTTASGAKIGTPFLPPDLDAKTAARGPRHHTQWMLAWSLGRPFYTPDGSKCFETVTANELPVSRCPSSLFLE